MIAKPIGVDCGPQNWHPLVSYNPVTGENRTLAYLTSNYYNSAAMKPGNLFYFRDDPPYNLQLWNATHYFGVLPETETAMDRPADPAVAWNSTHFIYLYEPVASPTEYLIMANINSNQTCTHNCLLSSELREMTISCLARVAQWKFTHRIGRTFTKQ